MGKIFIARLGRTYGPYSEEVARTYLKAGTLRLDDEAWVEGNHGWTTLDVVLDQLSDPATQAGQKRNAAVALLGEIAERDSAIAATSVDQIGKERAGVTVNAALIGEDIFLKSLALWLRARSYRIGLGEDGEQDIDLTKGVRATRAVVAALKFVLKVHTPMGEYLVEQRPGLSMQA